MRSSSDLPVSIEFSCLKIVEIMIFSVFNSYCAIKYFQGTQRSPANKARSVWQYFALYSYMIEARNKLTCRVINWCKNWLPFERSAPHFFLLKDAMRGHTQSLLLVEFFAPIARVGALLFRASVTYCAVATQFFSLLLCDDSTIAVKSQVYTQITS